MDFKTIYENGTLFIPIVHIFGHGLSLEPNTPFPLDLRILDEPINSSIYVSRCLTLARKNKKFVIYRKIKEELVNLFAEKYGEKNILAGSHSDCSDINVSDIDILVIDDKITVEMQNNRKVYLQRNDIVLADLSVSPPGFTRLYNPKTQNYLPLSYFENELLKFAGAFPHLKLDQVGPSINMKTTNNVSCDQVHGLKCSSWPPGVREEWLYRPRPFGWPPKRTVKELSKSDCFVVPTGRDDSKFSHLEWRFAFPYVERGLVWSLNNIQLQCFVLLKIINRTFLKKIDTDEINSFHIKMVLFWECQNSNQKHWSENKLFDCVRRCLKRLRIAINKKSLKHFIQADRNVLITKLKNIKSKEKIIKKIQEVENNIGRAIVECVRNFENMFLLIEMINIQFYLYKADTMSNFNRIISSRLLWLDKTCLIRTAIDIMSTISELSFSSEFQVIQDTLDTKTTLLFDEINEDNRQTTINYNLNGYVSDFMRDIHLITNNKVCHEKIEHILSEVIRICQALLDVHWGSILFNKATNSKGFEKRNLLSETERHFQNSVDMNNITGSLYLATFYIACGKHNYAQNIITTMFRLKCVVVCFSLRNSHAGISFDNGNGKLVRGFSDDFNQQSNYAFDVVLRIKYIDLVPNVLKYELCMFASDLEFLCMHPLMYAKLLQFLLSMKTTSGSEIRYLKELKEIINQISGTTGITFQKAIQELNVLAHCYRNIGFINEAIYFYMGSVLCPSAFENSAVFHIAFLLNKHFAYRNKLNSTFVNALDGSNLNILNSRQQSAIQPLDDTNSMTRDTCQYLHSHVMELFLLSILFFYALIVLLLLMLY